MTEQERKLTVDREIELLYWFYDAHHPGLEFSAVPTPGMPEDGGYYTVTCETEDWASDEIHIYQGVPRRLVGKQLQLHDTSLLCYLFEANTTDTEELIAYWIKKDCVTLREYYSREVAEIEAQGHLIVEIVPNVRDTYFATFRCKKNGLEYFIHTDDGDIEVTLCRDYYFGHPDNANHDAFTSQFKLLDDYVWSVEKVLEYYSS